MTEVTIIAETAGSPPAFTGRGFLGSDLITASIATFASSGTQLPSTVSTISGGVALRFQVSDSWLTLTSPLLYNWTTGQFVNAGPLTKVNNLPAE